MVWHGSLRWLGHLRQGCSLGLDVSVSRPIFPMSRSHLGELWDGLGLGLVSDWKTKCLGLVSGLVPEGLKRKEIKIF